MRRLLMVITLCVMTFWGSNTSAAKGFGVTGGASFVGFQEVGAGLTSGYHVGLTYKLDLPLGFAIQPSILYHMKGSVVDGAYADGQSLDFKAGYLEVPVSIQWGPDLILFRPFLDVTPFVGYGLNNNISGTRTLKNQWEDMKRLEYGLGVGIGLDVWKFQVIGRYNWNFGTLFNPEGSLTDSDNVLSHVSSSIFDGNNFGGLTLTVAFFF